MVAVAALSIVGVLAAPLPVELVKKGGSWELLRGGKPYFIKGAGGTTSLDLLARMGGNSIRTWGDGPEIPKILDEAQKAGITVTVGIWLGHERHGFDYSNKESVQKQFEAAREVIRKYKNHPAVLMWGLGNEMEGFSGGDSPLIWKHINEIALMAEKEDPTRPTISVVAEVNPAKVAAIHRYAPALDVVGINAYAGATSTVSRYKEAGGTKPVVITEFGPNGPWESPKTGWGVAIEPTSAQKAAMYKNAYEKAVLAHPGLVLGSYAFLWGWKMETTATWFGMLLPDGSPLPQAQAMQEAWTGKAPANRAPIVDAVKVKGDSTVAPGAMIQVEAVVRDPEGDPLQVEWKMKTENTQLGAGGDAEPMQKILDEAKVSSQPTSATFRAPNEERGYRIFYTVRDSKGNAATGNVPILVEDATRAKAGVKVSLPAYVFQSGKLGMLWSPSGFMNQPDKLSVTPTSTAARTPGGSVLMMSLNSNSGWGGVVFQSPEGDWGDKDGGYDLRGATRLVFWARGDKGGEKIKFEFGILGRDKRYFDTARGELQATLTKEWKEYVMPLKDLDLKRIKTGFVWTTASEGQPIKFYATDIRYE